MRRRVLWYRDQGSKHWPELCRYLQLHTAHHWRHLVQLQPRLKVGLCIAGAGMQEEAGREGGGTTGAAEQECWGVGRSDCFARYHSLNASMYLAYIGIKGLCEGLRNPDNLVANAPVDHDCSCACA